MLSIFYFTSFSIRKAAGKFMIIYLGIHGFGCATFTLRISLLWVAKCHGMGCLQSDTFYLDIQLQYETLNHFFSTIH